MDEQQRKQLDEQGYLIFKTLLSSEDMAQRPENRRQHVDDAQVGLLAPRERILLGLED